MKKITIAATFAILSISASAQWTTSGANIYNSNSGNVGIGTTSPGYRLTIAGSGGVLGVDNSSTFMAKNASGVYDSFLWPRWSDNIMYLNYGSGGFHIRNNSSATTMFMTNSGNVGIGTTTPGSPLSIVSGYGKYDFGSAGANFFQAKVENTATSGYGYSGFRSITNSTIEGMLVTYLSTDAAMQFGVARGGWSGIYHTGGNGLMIGTIESKPVLFGTNSLEQMRIDGAGNVGIGTTDTKGYKLAVNGSAVFTKAVVKLNSAWPDYVFAPSYKMPKLDSLEQFIKANGHLPEIPTAENVEKDGIDLANNQALLLKKIEELTLIVIEQNKSLIEQDKRIEKQQHELEVLKKLVR